MKIAFLKLLKIEDLKTPLKKCEENEDHVVCREPPHSLILPGNSKIVKIWILVKKITFIFNLNTLWSLWETLVLFGFLIQVSVRVYGLAY